MTDPQNANTMTKLLENVVNYGTEKMFFRTPGCRCNGFC
ncbi:hypothetical protein SBF1_1890005 [Candidatus Desulfosporosinus infrequens]|uniref:Uncharacterized protein n=1 Tax=Candidatus Desulfosporosinus infrequens TaxID=2043169 RepID=A0A2U3KEG9_9FIRM|nr:hypothetical protein SBF1_1890005 [Candidatus Desulfosporosinus infrequens]